MNRLVCGIDLGLDGGVAVADASVSSLVVIPMPTLKRAKREIDVRGLRDFLLTYDKDRYALVVIESVHAFGHEGKSSLFSFGRGTGKVQALLELYDLPYQEVKPSLWKNCVLKGTKKDKDAAVEWCSRRWPGVYKSRHDGMADAICLAEYARRQLIPTNES